MILVLFGYWLSNEVHQFHYLWLIENNFKNFVWMYCFFQSVVDISLHNGFALYVGFCTFLIYIQILFLLDICMSSTDTIDFSSRCQYRTTFLIQLYWNVSASTKIFVFFESIRFCMFCDDQTGELTHSPTKLPVWSF